MGFIEILTLVLVVAKLFEVLDAPWLAVFAPMAIVYAIQLSIVAWVWRKASRRPW